MSEQEKRTAEKLADALNALPEDKKDRLLAYAEGMAAMADRDRLAIHRGRRLRPQPFLPRCGRLETHRHRRCHRYTAIQAGRGTVQEERRPDSRRGHRRQMG